MRVIPAQVAAVLCISRQKHPLPGAVLLGRSQPCPAQAPAADLCVSYPYLSQENKTSTHTDTQTPLSCLYMTPDFAYCSDYLTIFPL